MQPFFQHVWSELPSQRRLRPPQVLLHGRYFKLALRGNLLDARNRVTEQAIDRPDNLPPLFG